MDQRNAADARFHPQNDDTAEHFGWRRVITGVTGTERRPHIRYTLQGPGGHVFEMDCNMEAWSDDLGGARVFSVGGALAPIGPTAADVPAGSARWVFLMALALSVPVAEWVKTHRDGVRRATLGSAYGPLFIDISMRPEIIIQIGSGPRGYHFRRGDLMPEHWTMLERLADYVFECGGDVEAKLSYIFGGPFPS